MCPQAGSLALAEPVNVGDGEDQAYSLWSLPKAVLANSLQRCIGCISGCDIGRVVAKHADRRWPSSYRPEDHYHQDHQVHVAMEPFKPKGLEVPLVGAVIDLAKAEENGWAYLGTTNRKLVFQCPVGSEPFYTVISFPKAEELRLLIAGSHTNHLEGVDAYCDPIQPPDDLAPIFANVGFNLEAMMVTSDILILMADLGATDVAIPGYALEAEQKEMLDSEFEFFDGPFSETMAYALAFPWQGERPKKTLAFRFAGGAAVVSEIYWQASIPWPPYGVPPVPQAIPYRAIRPVKAQEMIRHYHGKSKQISLLGDLPKTASLGHAGSKPGLHGVLATEGAPLDAMVEDTLATLTEAYRTADHLSVGVSGGKDSVTVLQLLATVLDRLPPENRRTPVLIISQDTLVDNPVITAHVRCLREAVLATAEERGWPLTWDILVPDPAETFWVSMIGRGWTLSKANRNKWCVRTLKLSPSERKLRQVMGEYHPTNPVLLTGVRTDESSNRAASIERHAIDDFYSDHPLPPWRSGTPIRRWSTDNVFEYLAGYTPLWGRRYGNENILRIYANVAGECPLGVSHAGSKDTGESQMASQCGKSRTGCWVCGAVKDDTGLERLSTAAGGAYDNLLKVRRLVFALSDPANGFRAGYQRTAKHHQYKQGFGEIGLEASALLLNALADNGLPLVQEEVDAILANWDRRAGRGEIVLTQDALSALALHDTQEAVQDFEGGSVQAFLQDAYISRPKPERTPSLAELARHGLSVEAIVDVLNYLADKGHFEKPEDFADLENYWNTQVAAGVLQVSFDARRALERHRPSQVTAAWHRKYAVWGVSLLSPTIKKLLSDAVAYLTPIIPKDQDLPVDQARRAVETDVDNATAAIILSDIRSTIHGWGLDMVGEGAALVTRINELFEENGVTV